MEDYQLKKLQDNFEKIQERIDGINSSQSIDIKQISDLQRYTSMQKEIVESIRILKRIKEYGL